jgi:hypothetical protein
MLTAYYDDSGTHDSSEVVVWGGLFANQHQWKYFEELWRAKLSEPSPGKLPLSRFHMYDCQSLAGEFAGWSRTASDFLVHELGNIILRTGLWGYSCAVFRKDWDELVHGVNRKALGDPEEFCLLRCFIQSLEWARQVTADPDIAYVFDDRPHRRERIKKVFDVFDRVSMLAPPKLASLTFARAARLLPLQAADLIAWESYQNAMDIREAGKPLVPKRRQFERIGRGKRFHMQFSGRERIAEFVTRYDGDPAISDFAALLLG